MDMLNGKVALVSGAARGIGAAIAEALAHNGAKVVIGDLLDEEGQARAEQIGPSATYVHLDVTNRDDWNAAVATAVERYGKLDVLVNNAGLGTNHDALDATEEEWDELMAVNLKGAFLACQAAGRHMVEQGYGRIVNMSSQAAAVGLRRHAAYSASKAGLEGLTRVLAVEWRPTA
jgi:NAD(P)-dependent dehydrogenase (short-subunit alcohol dehydrogenase family)